MAEDEVDFPPIIWNSTQISKINHFRHNIWTQVSNASQSSVFKQLTFQTLFFFSIEHSSLSQYYDLWGPTQPRCLPSITENWRRNLSSPGSWITSRFNHKGSWKDWIKEIKQNIARVLNCPEITILICHGDGHGIIHGVIHEVSHGVGLGVSQWVGDVHLCFLLQHLSLKQCSLWFSSSKWKH